MKVLRHHMGYYVLANVNGNQKIGIIVEVGKCECDVLLPFRADKKIFQVSFDDVVSIGRCTIQKYNIWKDLL